MQAGDRTITREGTGCGTASARDAGDAHERAIKGAETDATKRALATFGNRFGLCLYDKEKNGVSGAKPADRCQLRLSGPDGVLIAPDLSPEAFCSGVRQVVEKLDQAEDIKACLDKNRSEIDRLRVLAPQLKTATGVHYADVLEALIQRRLNHWSCSSDQLTSEVEAGEKEYGPIAPSRIADGPRIDKAAIGHGLERRYRHKAHLLAVAQQPCLVCGRQPSHAHHVRYAQKRGLGQKVSDEFVVPLCFLHHSELHNFGAEQTWWKRQGIEPLAVAHKLWADSRAGAVGVPLPAET